MVETLGMVLRTARKQRSLVLREVAEAVGVSTQAVGQWERDANEISMENLRVVAALLRIDPVAATRGELRYLDGAEEVSEVQRLAQSQPVALGPRDVPVLGNMVGGDDADFHWNGQVIDYVRRPPGIASLKNVWAGYVLGTSMSPRYEPGELLYAGGRPPVPGDDVIIELFPAEGQTVGKGFIKRLVSRSASEIVCKQFNPAKELVFNAYEIKQMTRVIPWTELLGY
ncbi:MAG: XRE family transcriptional regulator [Devosia sp.]